MSFALCIGERRILVTGVAFYAPSLPPLKLYSTESNECTFSVEKDLDRDLPLNFLSCFTCRHVHKHKHPFLTLMNHVTNHRMFTYSESGYNLSYQYINTYTQARIHKRQQA